MKVFLLLWSAEIRSTKRASGSTLQRKGLNAFPRPLNESCYRVFECRKVVRTLVVHRTRNVDSVRFERADVCFVNVARL